MIVITPSLLMIISSIKVPNVTILSSSASSTALTRYIRYVNIKRFLCILGTPLTILCNKFTQCTDSRYVDLFLLHHMNVSMYLS